MGENTMGYDFFYVDPMGDSKLWRAMAGEFGEPTATFRPFIVEYGNAATVNDMEK